MPSAVILAPAINMFPALGEEVGWRGYMMPRLKERFGLLNGRLLGGVVWGVWHWPLMLLVGYEYGTNYLGAPVLGIVVWCVVCFALNTLLDLLYEKTGCIWVPAIAHGAFNAIAALPHRRRNDLILPCKKCRPFCCALHSQPKVAVYRKMRVKNKLSTLLSNSPLPGAA